MPALERRDAIWVKMRTPIRAWTGKIIRWEEWEQEGFVHPEARHPRGKDHLVRVSYLYRAFNGWVKPERIRPRNYSNAKDSLPIQEWTFDDS